LEHLRNPEVVPDVIFLDLNMPMIDGWECLERLRRINHLATTPVVIYSTSEPPSENLTNKKGTLFLTKQPRISQLVIKLKAIFSQIETGHLC
ncbi:MAG: response regulator, partial [Bacteroidota bacterium]|nr:response regulator [Bacteroidota bacterium]